MKVCIHREPQEIGGTCIELEAEGKRIALDLGLPLDAGKFDDEESLLLQISGLKEPNDSLLALIIPPPNNLTICQKNKDFMVWFDSKSNKIAIISKLNL